MQTNFKFQCRILFLTLFVFAAAPAGFSRISREIQETYRQNYENKAMYLMIPIYSGKQNIYISGQNFSVARGSGSPRYKVGDPVRIDSIDFGRDEIGFRLSGIEVAGTIEISFNFDGDLQDSFPNRAVFDQALESTFTEGLSIRDIEDAQKHFVEEEFNHSIMSIAGAASVSRQSVLESIAPHIPAYAKAQSEIKTLRSRMQTASDQLEQAQEEKQSLEAKLKAQQSEMDRLKKANTDLQQNISSSTSEYTSLEAELRTSKEKAQEYQRELAKIKSSLNIAADAKRDLASQISALQTDLEAQQEANARLEADNEELKAKSRKMQRTVNSLTSNKDSLAKRYVDLEDQKQKLEDLYRSMEALNTRIIEEKAEGGFYIGKAQVYLNNVLLGFLEWSIPIQIKHGQSKNAEAAFSAESIDYVRVTQEERQMLRSLGEKLKMRVDLASDSVAMGIKPQTDDPVRESAERERVTWLWNISNQGTQDARLLVTARLINQDEKEIVLFQQEPSIVSTNVVRQVRSYLQPVPLIAGILVGFLLFGIVGIFRRPKRQAVAQKQPGESPSEPPPSYVGQKKL